MQAVRFGHGNPATIGSPMPHRQAGVAHATTTSARCGLQTVRPEELKFAIGIDTGPQRERVDLGVENILEPQVGIELKQYFEVWVWRFIVACGNHPNRLSLAPHSSWVKGVVCESARTTNRAP